MIREFSLFILISVYSTIESLQCVIQPPPRIDLFLDTYRFVKLCVFWCLHDEQTCGNQPKRNFLSSIDSPNFSPHFTYKTKTTKMASSSSSNEDGRNFPTILDLGEALLKEVDMRKAAEKLLHHMKESLAAERGVLYLVSDTVKPSLSIF